MSIQTMGMGVVRCPCPGCGKMVDFKMLHPSVSLPYKTHALCRNLHPVELEFLEQGQDPVVRCLYKSS